LNWFQLLEKSGLSPLAKKIGNLVKSSWDFAKSQKWVSLAFFFLNNLTTRKSAVVWVSAHYHISALKEALVSAIFAVIRSPATSAHFQQKRSGGLCGRFFLVKIMACVFFTVST
jgi:hypothetical protein